MTKLLLLTVLLLGTSGVASAAHRRRARTSLKPTNHETASRNLGAKVDSGTTSTVATPPPVKLTTFVDGASARVEKDLMLFQPTLKRASSFFAGARVADDLEVRRDYDRLLLFRSPEPQGSSVGLGLAMFSAMTVLSAHAPRPLRIIFDGPVHLGPAVFDGGGMGAGVAGRGL